MTRLPAAQRAVILGSGLSLGADRFEVRGLVPYVELEWPVTGVPGHPSVVTVAALVPPARQAGGTAAVAGEGSALVLVAGGRPHRYEGWSDDDLERPARDLIAAGVERLLLVCACGALRDDLRRGDLCVVGEVVDLQRAPQSGGERLPLCSEGIAASVADRAARAAAVTGLPAAGGPALVRAVAAYAAVAGPQYETPAEAGWLAGLADVVGMSAAPEVRAAHSAGARVRLLAVVTNASGASLGHSDVLDAGARLGPLLTAVVSSLLEDEELWQ